jgi:hypothetical protein
MKPYTRMASVLWLGTRQHGKGALTTLSAVLNNMPYASGSDLRRRGTSPARADCGRARWQLLHDAGQ